MAISHRDEQLHRKAVDLIRSAYDVVDGMRKVDIEALNEPRPPTMRYHAQYELVMEFMNRAAAMLELAGQLGLIEPEEDAEIRRSISHELIQWLADEDKRLSGEQ